MTFVFVDRGAIVSRIGTAGEYGSLRDERAPWPQWRSLYSCFVSSGAPLATDRSYERWTQRPATYAARMQPNDCALYSQCIGGATHLSATGIAPQV